jgi:hypothetical protein
MIILGLTSYLDWVASLLGGKGRSSGHRVTGYCEEYPVDEYADQIIELEAQCIEKNVEAAQVLFPDAFP